MTELNLSNETIAKYIIDNGLNINKREINIFDNISDDCLKKFSNQLSLLESISNADITINIHSDGGSIRSGKAIIELIQNSNCKIITKALSSAYSMAFLIFMAGEKRLVSKFSSLMYHETKYSFGNYREGSEIKEYCKQFESEFEEIFRWLGSRTKLNYKYWKEFYFKKGDHYFSPKEAIELGIAHDFIKKEPLKLNKKVETK